MGVYSNAMFVGADFPVTIPKFCMSIVYTDAADTEHAIVPIRIYQPSDKDDEPSTSFDLPLSELIANAPKTNPSGEPITEITASMDLVSSPFQIVSPGLLKIVAVIRGEEMELGCLHIVQAPRATAVTSSQ